MKKIKITLTVTILLIVLSSVAQVTGTFTDSRDGNIYKTVTIGTQTMMSANLAFKPISGNYWAYNNDISNVAKYGYLYDWKTAKTIAPPGWHLPAREEWETMYKYLGNNDEKVFTAVKESGSSGFNALLGGCRDFDGKFVDFGTVADFWSSTPADGNFAWHFFFFPYTGYAFLYHSSSNYGLSVRLFRD